MQITLNSEEIRRALSDALGEKTQYVHGTFKPEACYFDGMNAENYQDLTFSIEVETK